MIIYRETESERLFIRCVRSAWLNTSRCYLKPGRMDTKRYKYRKEWVLTHLGRRMESRIRASFRKIL